MSSQGQIAFPDPRNAILEVVGSLAPQGGADDGIGGFKITYRNRARVPISATVFLVVKNSLGFNVANTDINAYWLPGETKTVELPEPYGFLKQGTYEVLAYAYSNTNYDQDLYEAPRRIALTVLSEIKVTYG